MEAPDTTPAVLAAKPAALLHIENIIMDLPHNGAWQERPRQGITDITIHHSASGVSEKASSMANWHIVGKKWPGIAYHFLVYHDGRVYQTNPIKSLTFHNGFNNRAALGICLVGNFTKRPPTAEQLFMTQLLCLALRVELPNLHYCTGHGEYKNGSLCPGHFLRMEAFRESVGMKISPRARFPRL